MNNFSQWRQRTSSLACRRFWTSVYNNWKRVRNLWKCKWINIRRMSHMRSETWCDCQTATSSLWNCVRIWKTSSWDHSASRSEWELFIDWSYSLSCEFTMSSASSCFVYAQITLYWVNKHLHQLSLSQKMRRSTERLITYWTQDNTVNNFSIRSNGVNSTETMSDTTLTRVNLTDQSMS